MKNHFHLLLETPEPNLVAGMKWLLGTYSQGWNASRKRHGHVFQGRYKAIPVNADDNGGTYFMTVANYIHLNPARAGLAGGVCGPLTAYRWSSLGHYTKGTPPPWLKRIQVLASLGFAEDAKGRRAYVAWLEAKAEATGNAADTEALEALRRGWYLGDDGFRNRLLSMVGSTRLPRNGSVDSPVVRDHGEQEAERLVVAAAGVLGLPAGTEDLSKLRKGDKRKILIAALVRAKTVVGSLWIARRLQMGHPASISRMVKLIHTDKSLARKLKELEKMFKC